MRTTTRRRRRKHYLVGLKVLRPKEREIVLVGCLLLSLAKCVGVGNFEICVESLEQIFLFLLI